MAGPKNWFAVQFFLLFCFHLSCTLDARLTYRPSLEIANSWKNNPSIEQGSWDFFDGSTIRPILFVTDSNINPPFAFGFLGNKTAARKSFYLVVFAFATTNATGPNPDNVFWINSNYAPIIVWSANRDKPVSENATLDFTSKGDLLLKDADGSLVWSTYTSGLSVTRLSIAVGGNLMLLNGRGEVKWQSFDYPTDTWLPNQNISVGKRLTASISSSNLATGMYYLSVTLEGLYAYFSSNDLKAYLSLTFDSYSEFSDTALGVTIKGPENVLKDDPGPEFIRFNLENISLDGFRYIKLEPDGHLRVYRLDGFDDFRINTTLLGDLLRDDRFGECAYPTACGNYGICSDGQQCSCPGGDFGYFRQLQDLQPTLGCKPVNPLSCKRMQLHTFVELKTVTYYNFEGFEREEVSDVESCKNACFRNCTCKAALFRYTENNSSGNCSLLPEIYSLTTASIDSVAFIKIQESPDKKKSLAPIFVSSFSAVLLITIFMAGSYYCYKRLKHSKYNDEDEDVQVIGALRRFSFLDLKSATTDFRVRLGRGGFGSVFEGELDDGTKVAVKCLDSIGQGRKEFLAEVNTIGSIHHFNLVRLIGYCAERSNKLLVYEYMCNGSLDKWIFHPDGTQILSWEITRKVIIGLAKGLEYLHMHCNPNIIHFDIKTPKHPFGREFQCQNI